MDKSVPSPKSLPSSGATSEWNGALVILFRSAKLQERIDSMFIAVYNDYRYLMPLQEAIYLFYTCFSPLAKRETKDALNLKFENSRKKTRARVAYYSISKDSQPTYIPDLKLIDELREIYTDCIDLRQYVGAGFPTRKRASEREALTKLLRGNTDSSLVI